MKSRSLFSTIALVLASFGCHAASGQVAPDRPVRVPTGPDYKYMVYAGAGYTSLNQVNQSRYGLIGVDLQANRDFGRFFAVSVDGAFYPTSVSSGNPGKPSVWMLLAGPEVHGHIFDQWSIFARALLGGEHTGGESMTPNVSFAGGGGAGVEYQLNPRIVIRASGDDIASAFSVRGNTPDLGYSPHTRRNSRASIGIGFRF